jgi:hypothetical protein
MATLATHPYYLNVDDRIKVRVRAENSRGFGPNSDVIFGPLADKAPERALTPRELFGSDDSITITWGTAQNEGTTEITHYLIEQRDSPNAEPRMHTVGVELDNIYEIRGISQASQYFIRMAAVNSCGVGGYSENLEFVTRGCPKQMNPPAVTLRGTNVVIEWEEGRIEDGLPIIGYEVQLKQANGMLTPLERYCDVRLLDRTQRRECSVPMEDVELLSGLQPDDLVQISVRALNEDCFGSFSLYNTEGARIVACPSQMEPVNAEPNDISESSITLNWQPVVSTGGYGVEIESYELQWRICGDSNWKDGNIISVDGTSYIHLQLRDLTCYEYRVRSRSAFCASTWSKLPNSRFVASGTPNAIGTPETTVVPILRGAWNGEAETFNAPTIQIQWPEPDINEMVTSYSVFILNRDDVFLENKKLCDGSDQMVVDSRTCRIPMSMFWSGNWKLDQGQIITVKVVANNARGQGEMSVWNIDGAHVEKLPHLMNPPYGSLNEETSEIILTWPAVFTPRDGGTPVTSYHIEYRYDLDPQDAWQELVGFSMPHLKTEATHSDLRPASLVNYRIRAKNRWGWGPWSYPDLVMISASSPDRVTAV